MRQALLSFETNLDRHLGTQFAAQDEAGLLEDVPLSPLALDAEEGL